MRGKGMKKIFPQHFPLGFWLLLKLGKNTIICLLLFFSEMPPRPRPEVISALRISFHSPLPFLPCAVFVSLVLSLLRRTSMSS